jgi:hypothetical protein
MRTDDEEFSLSFCVLLRFCGDLSGFVSFGFATFGYVVLYGYSNSERRGCNGSSKAASRIQSRTKAETRIAV